MLILLIIIFAIIGTIITIKTDGWSSAPIIYWTLFIIISLIIIPIFIFSYPYNVSEKLSMYEEENTKIEEKVKATVQGYMNYETDTYKNLVESADIETLLIKYPELNSNELVKSEIELYKENNKKIKELKEQEITKPVWDWWLRFNIGQ